MSGNSPTISDIINNLKTTFRDTDFADAKKKLSSREHHLNHRLRSADQNNEILGSELCQLKLDQIAWDTERCRLNRELDVKEDQLSDLTRDLGVTRDSEAKALKRYDRALEYARRLEDEKEELVRMFEEEKGGIASRLSELKEDYDGLETELVGLRLRCGVLVEEKAKLADEVVGLKMKLSEKEARIVSFSIEKGEIEGLRRRIAVLEGEKAKFGSELEGLRRNLSEKDEKYVGILREKREIQGLMREKEVLEGEKAEIGRRLEEKEGEFKELMRRIEVLGKEINEIQVEKNRKISGLEREKECLEKEKLELTALFKRVDEDLENLQGEVISTICLDVERGGKLASSKIGKIFAGVLSQLDAEGGVGDLPSNGDGKKDSGFDLLAKGPKSLLKSTTKSQEATMRPLILTGELFAKDDANHNNKAPCPPDEFIPSDDENDDIPPRHGGFKRKSDFSSSLIYIHDDGSDDGSLNQKSQTKKMKGEQDETPMGRQYVAASGSDHKFSTPERQSLADIRKFEDTVSRELNGLKAGDLADVGKCFNSSGKTKNFLSPHLKEAIVKCKEKLQKRSVECSTDIIWVSKRDPTFCCKAVCALYRQHSSLVTSGSKVFRDSDVERKALFVSKERSCKRLCKRQPVLH